MYFAPSALVQATRSRWMIPSGMIARGSPFWQLNNRMRPQNLPPGAAACFSFRSPSGLGRQRTTSELRRIAATSKRGRRPSIVLKI